MSHGQQVRIWDLATRLFHAGLILGVALQFASAEFHWLSMERHIQVGYGVLGLLVFRLAWGFVGSDSARFSAFLRGPSAWWQELRGEAGLGASHSPLGGLAVLITLALLLAIVVTGLASSDDIDVEGPLVPFLDGTWVRLATRWHHRMTAFLPWWIGLHVAAVLWHEMRGQRLIAAMWHGRRMLTGPAPRIASNGRAAWVALIAFLLVLVFSQLL